jgi:N-methylhydantoinase A/oxoprolinase/acetone carboxylase beta subunit
VSEEPLPSPARRRRRRSQAVPLGRAHVLLDRGPRDVDFYSRADLAPGVRLRGPIVLSELSSTAWVAPGFTLRADDYGNLHLETR